MIITPEQLKKASNVEKCRMMKEIIRGEATYSKTQSGCIMPDEEIGGSGTP
jgi:hypothetical protein